MRLLSPLLAIAVLHLSLPMSARAAEPCDRPCYPDETADQGAGDEGRCGCAPEDARDQATEEHRRAQERLRLAQAARIRAEQEAAIQAQRSLELYQEESVAATRRRVGGMALAMAATTGCLTALSVYLGGKGTATGQRSYRPITQGLGGFTVATALLGTGFLLSGMWANTHDLALDVGSGGRMVASLGWRFH
jgi:hypothetical protein